MRDPRQWLTPGDKQTKILDGIVNHGYRKHVIEQKEFGDPSRLSRQRYRSEAAKLLNGGSELHALKQNGSVNYLMVDHKTNGVVYVNSKDNASSTFFRPRRGTHAYLARRLNLIPPSHRKQLDLVNIRKQQKAVPASKSVVPRKADKGSQTKSIRTPKPALPTPPKSQPRPSLPKPTPKPGTSVTSTSKSKSK